MASVSTIAEDPLSPVIHVFRFLADYSDMAARPEIKKSVRCAYIYSCYLADELKCFGYKTDCPLYQKSNGDYCSEDRFHNAVNKLIDRTRAKYINPD